MRTYVYHIYIYIHLCVNRMYIQYVYYIYSSIHSMCVCERIYIYIISFPFTSLIASGFLASWHAPSLRVFGVFVVSRSWRSFRLLVLCQAGTMLGFALGVSSSVAE